MPDLDPFVVLSFCQPPTSFVPLPFQTPKGSPIRWNGFDFLEYQPVKDAWMDIAASNVFFACRARRWKILEKPRMPMLVPKTAIKSGRRFPLGADEKSNSFHFLPQERLVKNSNFEIGRAFGEI